MYADYTYYTETYKGNAIPLSDYDRLALRASSYLDKLTMGRIKEPTEDIKMAVCAVAEAWLINEQGGDVTSQSVGSWSKTYAKKIKTDDQRLYDAAQLHLANTNLVSRWI